MTQETKKIIKNFITNNFNVKKRKIKGQWCRVIEIPYGYVRKNNAFYYWQVGLESDLAIVDLIDIVSGMYGVEIDEAKEIVLEIIEDYPAKITKHEVKSSKKPKKVYH